MINQFGKTLLCCLLLLSLVACTGVLAGSEAPPAMPIEEGAEVTLRSLLEQGDVQNWTGLTHEQMLEDWDYLYDALVDNYPYFGVVERTTGIDLHQSYQIVRDNIPAFDSDVAFFLAVYDFIEQTESAGHFSLRFPEPDDDSPQVYADAYGLLYPAMAEVNGQSSQTGSPSTPEPNVTTEIIEEGKTAYVKINSFLMDNFDADEVILYDFYEQIGDYNNLIIDITENSGGGMGYYFDLIFAPLLQEPSFYYTYCFIKGGDLNRQDMVKKEGSFENWYSLTTTPQEVFEKQAENWPPEKAEQIRQTLSGLPWPPEQMNMDDFAEFDYYDIGIMSFAPQDRLFHGKVWLLVSDTVYSSAESFAIASKETGFATIVGTQTGGDGIGSDPVIFQLPNSGLYIRYAPIYGTTLDGRSSEEFGTTPDIISSEGKTALETCLEAIDAA